MRFLSHKKSPVDEESYRAAAQRLVRQVLSGATFPAALAQHEPAFVCHPPVEEHAAWQKVLEVHKEALQAEATLRFTDLYRVLRLSGESREDSFMRAYKESTLIFWGDDLPAGEMERMLGSTEQVETHLPPGIRASTFQQETREAIRRCTQEAVERRRIRQARENRAY